MSFFVHGHDLALNFEARNGVVNYATGGAPVNILDRGTGCYCPSTLSDLYDLARMADDLTNIQWFARPAMATDIEGSLDVACAAIDIGIPFHAQTGPQAGATAPAALCAATL